MVMTDEDFKRLLMSQTARQQGVPQMSSADPMQVSAAQRAAAMRNNAPQLASAENRIDRGYKAMMAPGAQGKQMGRVYVGPTWSEGLSSAIKKGMGAYDVAKGRKDRTTAQEAQEETAAGKAAVADEERLTKASAAADAAAMAERGIALKEAQAATDIENTEYERQKALDDEERRQRELEEEIEREKETAKQLAIERRRLEKLKGRQERKTNAAEAELEDAGMEDIPGVNPQDLKALEALPAGERKYARQSLSTITELNKAINAASEVLKTGGSFTGGEDVLVGLAEAISPKSLENVARGLAKRGVYEPDEQNVKGLLTNGAEAFKRARTGANLTQPETVLGENWDPGAPGITDQEALRRAVNIASFLNDDLANVGLSSREIATPWAPEMKAKGRQQGGRKVEPQTSQAASVITEQDVDNMSLEELKGAGLL